MREWLRCRRRQPGVARSLVLDAWSRLEASDPGFARLRIALSATVCVGTVVPVQVLAGSVFGYDRASLAGTTVFGALVAMVASNATVFKSRSGVARTAAIICLAVTAGIAASTAAAAGGSRAWEIIGFVAVLFTAVWVRRFGPDWMFHGLVAWMAYFLATFLDVTWRTSPRFVAAALISALWVSLLSMVLFHTQSKRVFRSVLGAYFGRARAVARESADLLHLPASSGWARRRTLRGLALQRSGLADVGLLADAWSAVPEALPRGWSASELRKHAIATQQAVDRFAEAAITMRGDSSSIRSVAASALSRASRGDNPGALAALEKLDELSDLSQARGEDSWWPARHISRGLRDLIRLEAGRAEPPEAGGERDDFESVTELILGALPGSPAVARGVPTRGTRWNPTTRLSLTTRQAVQVTLAGLLAMPVAILLSPTHYYWALIAVFVTFTGTGTRIETLLRAYARIIGTMAGIGAAFLVAAATAGHSVLALVTILACVFLMFYLNKVSFLASTFFVTILLGQMLAAMGTFSDHLLEVRLGETAIGAGLGVAVAMVFAPLSTRDTVRAARIDLLVALETLLRGTARSVAGDLVNLDALVRAVDERARNVALVAGPLSRTLISGRTSARTARRLSLYASAVTQVRALAVSVQIAPVSHPGLTANVAWALADAARALVTVIHPTPTSGDLQSGRAQLPAAIAELVANNTAGQEPFALLREKTSARGPDPVLRHLFRLSGTFAEISETADRRTL